MGALHINGQKTTGLNINLTDGVFIDTDNVIVSKTSYTPSTFSYTATEDCVLYIEIPAQGGYSTFLEIDGEKVQGVNIAGSGTTNYLIATVLLKKGQTATLSSSSFPSVTPDYAVYGIQQGTIEGKLQPVIYSTEEREVGVWSDGKPLYEKTIYCPNIVKGQDNIINHNISNLETTVRIWGRCEYNNSGEILPLPYISSADGYFIIFGNVTSTRFQVSPGNNFTSIENCYVTIQYTKTTDQAGTGTWTPDGAYAHHYSTDEKVVGTWVDGSTIYEKTTAISITITNADTFYNTGLSANGIDTFIGGTVIDIRNQSFPASVVKMNNDANIGVSIPNGNRDTTFLTYQYTKASS